MEQNLSNPAALKAGSGPGWNGFLALALVVVGLATYAGSLHGPFIFDDRGAIVDNPHIRELWPPSRLLSAVRNGPTQGRPVASLSFALNHAMGGLNVVGYHLVNLAIHLLNALLLFALLRRTLQRPRLRTAFAERSSGLAFAGALLWLVHPLSSECVSYVTQRTESLMATFYLATFYCAMRAWETRHKKLWVGAATFCCALGMGTKEVMISAPVVLFFYDYLLEEGPWARTLRRRIGLYAALASTWVLLAALMLTRPLSNVGFTVGVSAWDYAQNQALLLVDYLRLVFWPRPLVLDYGFPELDLGLGQVAPYGLFVLALLTATLVGCLRRSPLALLGVWCFGILAPSSSVVPLVSEVGAERRMYLPLAGLLFALVLAFDGLLRWSRERRGAVERTAGAKLSSGATLVLLSLLLASATVRRNAQYADDLTIWQSAVEARPGNARAHLNLGRMREERGELELALENYLRAIELRPNYAKAHHNVGVIHAREGRVGEAVRYFLRAIEIYPEYAKAHKNLGLTYQLLNKPEPATQHFARAIQLRPSWVEAHVNLAVAQRKLGRLGPALNSLLEAARLRPDDAQLEIRISNVLRAQNRLDESTRHARRALSLEPQNPRAHAALARALRQAGLAQEALEHERAAEALRRQAEQ